MNSYTKKTNENKSQSIANDKHQERSNSRLAFQFIDNRPGTVGLHKSRFIEKSTFLEQKPVQKKEENTGLPDPLKSGIEQLSGYSMDDVKVHYNSDKPAQLQAHAFAQGNQIHLGSGQERHLPHEAWHVVQQKQGRVKPTIQMKGKVNINDDTRLEKEADVMGAKAMQMKSSSNDFFRTSKKMGEIRPTIQRAVNLNVGTLATPNGHYSIKSTNTHILYSLRTVPEPVPASLYKKETEVSTTAVNLFKWSPNVRLFRNHERAAIETDGEENDTSAIMAGMDNKVQNPVASPSTVRMPSKGVLGKNDCGGWAGTLRTLVAQEGVDNQVLGGQAMGLGDQMTHHYPDGEACQYHSATVVARDGVGLVTLEAHVSKNLAKPEFHIRNGVAGFVHDNDTDAHGHSRNLGNNVTITRASGKAGSDQDMGILKGIHATYARHTSDNYLVSNPGVTDTKPLLNRRRAVLLRVLTILGKDWGPYTWVKSAPSGIVALRGIVAGVRDEATAIDTCLSAVKVRATADLSRASKNRHQATTDLYTVLGRMNFESMDGLQKALTDLQHIINEIDAGRV